MPTTHPSARGRTYRQGAFSGPRIGRASRPPLRLLAHELGLLLGRLRLLRHALLMRDSVLLLFLRELLRALLTLLLGFKHHDLHLELSFLTFELHFLLALGGLHLRLHL